MKYFDISVNDSYRTSPQITNWYEEIKVRLINWETYHKLPRRKVLMITSSPNTIFTDIISFPFLLVSPMIKDVIRLQLWADKTIGISHAFQNARSNYIFINSTMDEINAAFNLPGGMPDPAVSDYINGLKEISKEKAEEIARYITGEKGAETVGEIFDTSEEWKEKQSRKIDRERLDKAGKKYGYADKGSLQYPMVNNRGDDWKIIVGTWGEPRGFLTYTYTVTGIMDICSSKI